MRSDQKSGRSDVALLRAPGELGVFMTSASTVTQHHWHRSDHIDLESDLKKTTNMALDRSLNAGRELVASAPQQQEREKAVWARPSFRLCSEIFFVSPRAGTAQPA